MRQQFSIKYGYDPSRSKTPIFEDAPRWVRYDYFNNILKELIYVDKDDRYPNKDNKPIPVKDTIARFCSFLRIQTENADYDSWLCMEQLENKLENCEWYSFYDFVEMIGNNLLKSDSINKLDLEWLNRYGFSKYKNDVNTLFEFHLVEWKLDENSHFYRTIPDETMKAITDVGEDLKEKCNSALTHMQKSKRYLYEFPIDPENSIKEITSSIESLLRTHFPNSNTLGKAIQELRTDKLINTNIIALIEKFYAYASSEPAVRHGSPMESIVTKDEAELCFQIGISIIKYIIVKYPD